MSKEIIYNQNEKIYKINENADKIYYIQSGKVQLKSDVPKNRIGEHYEREAFAGEFIAMEAAILKLKSDETAVVLEKGEIFDYTLEEFKKLLIRDQKLTIAALKCLSQKLRDLNAHCRNLVGETKEMNPPQGMLLISEYLYQKSEFKQAQYVFETYLNEYPNGVNKKRIKILLNNIRDGSPNRNIEDIPPLRTEIVESKETNELLNVNQVNKHEKNIYITLKKMRSAIVRHDFHVGLNYANQLLAKDIRDQTRDQASEQASDQIIQEAMIMKAIAKYSLKDYNQAESILKQYLSGYPRGYFIQACCYQLGLVYERQQNIKQAEYLYNQLLQLAPESNALTISAKNRLKIIEKREA